MKRILFLAPSFICAAGIITIIVIADNGPLPSFLRPLYHYPFGDKVGHFVLFGIFTFTANLALSGPAGHGARASHFTILNATIVAVVTIEEFSQIFFATRNFSLLDLISGYAGIVCFAFFAQKLGAKMGRKRIEGELTKS